MNNAVQLWPITVSVVGSGHSDTGHVAVDQEKLTYTINEARAALGIGRTHLYAQINAGKLPVRKLGKRTLILAEDLRSFAAALPVAA